MHHNAAEGISNRILPQKFILNRLADGTENGITQVGKLIHILFGMADKQ